MVDITKLRIRLAIGIASLIGGEIYVKGLIGAMAMNEYCLKNLTGEERFEIYQEYKESLQDIYRKW